MIDPEIQAWIDKDTAYLNTCTEQQYQKYVAWFYDPATPVQSDWYTAIDALIKSKETV
jgi:hypothetical protein